jgi:hypothetical protein
VAKRRARRVLQLALLVLSGFAIVARAQVPASAPAHLGKVYFQTSCSGDAQALFEKGLALLHSFQYTEARQTFEQAQAADGKCAMALWGKAMSRYEQLWQFPSEKQMKESHDEIA